MFYLVLQNTLSKQIFTYEVQKVSEDSIYGQFKIKLSNPVKGDYDYILYEGNPIDKKNLEILIANKDILTTGAQILIVGEEINIVSKGVLRIGDYENNIPENNINNTFKQYGS